MYGYIIIILYNIYIYNVYYIYLYYYGYIVADIKNFLLVVTLAIELLIGIFCNATVRAKCFLNSHWIVFFTNM